MSSGRLIVVSNRLPITVAESDSGFLLQPSGGGLVSALVPVLRQAGGCWIGWTGTDHDSTLAQALNDQTSIDGYSLEPVFLSPLEKQHFYHGCCNEIIWPLFHGLPSRCQFDPAYWTTYCRVTEKFADAVNRVSAPDDFIWIHDYHLMTLGAALRILGVQNRLAYFHHIPFPPLDVFEKLPWKKELLDALMRLNVIGFQTDRDRNNFVSCVRHCLRHVQVHRRAKRSVLRTAGRSITAATYPVSIDYEAFASCACAIAADTLDLIRQGLSGTKILLGVDRLDYTKGVPERLNAFRILIEKHPNLRGRVTMVQIVIPSREEIPEYTQLKLRIETLVSKINGEFSMPGWIPIHHFYRTISRAELLAFYRAADVAVVTPLKDGMNLVAKEFCASRVDDRGVLVLSEFAGAAKELREGALLVNPYDAEAVASALHNGLLMEDIEQCRRMQVMRCHIRAHDVHRWSQSFRVESASRPIEPAQRTDNVPNALASLAEAVNANGP